MPAPTEVIESDFTDVYSGLEPDFSDLYDRRGTGGSGSEDADNFISSMFAFGTLDQNNQVTKQIEGYDRLVKATPNSELATVIDDQTKGVLAEAAAVQMDIVADLYARTGDPNLVGEADKVAEESEAVKTEPPASKLVRSALIRMGKEDITQIDKDFIARESMLAMVSEWLEYSGLGTKELITSMIPFRNTAQFLKEDGLDSYSEYQKKIQNFRLLMPEERVKEFPKFLMEMWEFSGKNPFIFQDRILPFIDDDEIERVQLAFAFDAADAATLVPFAKLARAVKAYRSSVKFAKNAGDPQTAAKLINEVLEDSSGTAEKAANVSRLDAISTARPFSAQGILPEVTDGLSPEIQVEIIGKLSKSREFLNKLIYDANALIQRSPLTEKEIVAAQQKYLTQFAGEAKIIESNPLGFTVQFNVRNPHFRPAEIPELQHTIDIKNSQITEFEERMQELKSVYKAEVYDLPEYDDLAKKVIKARKDVTKFEGQIKQAEAPELVAETRTIKYTKNDVGGFDALEYKKASPYINSPDRYINQLLKGVVEESTTIGFTQQQLRGFFEKATKGLAASDLSNAQRARVNQILLQGDTDKIGRYSSIDLMQGIGTGDNLIRLTEAKEIAAYHGLRDIFDTVYILKNRQLRQELEFEGFKSIKMPEEGVVSFVNPEKPIKQVPVDVERYYDAVTGEVLNVGSSRGLLNEQLQASNALFMKMKYPYEHGDELIEYVYAHQNHIKKLPDRVLAYRPGYVPRINKNIFFIAERVSPKVINGVPVPAFRSVARYFDSFDEAETWKGLEAAKGNEISIRSGREWLDTHPQYKQDYEAAVFGGLFSGKRSDEVIPFGLKGTAAEHIGAFEAMEAAIGHVSTRLPMNEFRIGMIRRYLNAARDPITGKSYLTNPSDWRSPVSTERLSTASKEYRSLEAMRGWMEDQLRLPTSQERAWENLAVRVANVIDNKNLRSIKAVNSLRLKTLNLAHKDIYGSMRGLAFHALLGWFNPSQLYVQALGASMAFSLDPAKAALLIPRYMALRASFWSDNPEVWRRTALAAGLKADDFEQLVLGFRKTGLKESVRSTADFDAAVHGYGHTASSLRRLADASLLFFREGETFVRGYGWLLAHSEFMKGKPLGYILKDADIDAITKRSLNYTMNLNRANRAHWQKGFLSIPTQFLQITAKFVENMAYNIKGGPGSWSRWDKSKIMAGQAIMFGAAGVPFGQWAAANLTEWLKDEGDYGLGIKDPETIAAINGGFAEWALYGLTGENIAISNRVAIPNGIESFLEMFLRADVTTGEKMLGAFGEVPSRFYEMVHNLAPVFSGQREEIVDYTIFLAAAEETGRLISTYRNVHKARMWERAKALLDSKGNPIMPLDPENNHMVVLAQSLGLAPRALESYYDIVKYNQVNAEDINNAANAWVEVARRYAHTDYATTEAGRKRVGGMIQWVLLGLTDEQKAEVAERVIDRLKQDDFKLTKELIEAIDNVQKTHGDTTKGVFGGNLELNPLMVPEKPKE